MAEVVGHQFNYEQILSGYRKEIEGLAVIAGSAFLRKRLPLLENYVEFIRNGKCNPGIKKTIKKLKAGDGLAKVGDHAAEFEEVFYIAHLAVCCTLFCGWKIPVQDLTREKLDVHVAAHVDRMIRYNNGSFKVLENGLQHSDSVRVVHILRQLGLLTARSETFRQLSIGAGSGARDIDAMHQIPKISMAEETTLVQNAMQRTELLHLSVIPEKPSEAVLVDADPEFVDHYKKLNAGRSTEFKLLALNTYLDNALDELPALLAERDMQPFNLIVGFRIDHCMIPDVEAFFKMLTGVMSDSADLIITIGAGHSLEEFVGRENKIKDLFDYLKGKGLSPVRLRLAYGVSSEERRRKPAFGVGPITSYEILYCKLKRKKLAQ